MVSIKTEGNGTKSESTFCSHWQRFYCLQVFLPLRTPTNEGEHTIPGTFCMSAGYLTPLSECGILVLGKMAQAKFIFIQGVFKIKI